MRVPIPDDWNGEDWACFQINWPDSDKWIGFLIGLLTYATRGRVWDENTGSILDTQRIGWAISDANLPLTDCTGETVLIRTETIERFTPIGVESESDSMGWLCGVNPNAFKIENGALWVKDFCGEWVQIGELLGPGSVPVTTIPNDDPTIPYSACGKAYSFISNVALLLQAMIDNFQSPGNYESELRAVLPFVSMSRANIYASIPQLYTLGALYSWNYILDDNLTQVAICKAAVGMDTTTGEGTEEDLDFAIHSIKSAINEQRSDLNTELIFGIWTRAIQIIGENDSRLLISMGSQDFNADCECPNYNPAYIWQSQYDWVIDWEFEGQTPLGVTLYNSNGTTVITSEGLTIQSDDVGTETAGCNRDHNDGTFVVDAIHIDFDAEDWTPAEWGVSAPCIDESNIASWVEGEPGAYKIHAVNLGVDRAQVPTIGFGFQGNWDDGATPKFPVVKRIVLAGTGTHPFEGL